MLHSATRIIIFFLSIFMFLLGSITGAKISGLQPIYETNQAKYEIKFAKCLAYPKGNVKDCHEVAVFNSQMCVRGCE